MSMKFKVRTIKEKMRPCGQCDSCSENEMVYFFSLVLTPVGLRAVDFPWLLSIRNKRKIEKVFNSLPPMKS